MNIGPGAGFKVKRIWVNPGEVLSLQSHAFRSEHWVIVKGMGEVTVGQEKRLHRQQESAFIPSATIHQISNPGNEPLEFIEIQQGPYLGEDDIVRYADKYGRAQVAGQTKDA